MRRLKHLIHRLRMQSSLEFLVTYGWAILAIVIIAGVLWYFGVFDPFSFVDAKQSAGFNTFGIGDFSIASNGVVLLVLENRVGNTITSVRVSNSTCDVQNPPASCYCIPSRLAPDQRAYCLVDTGVVGTVGQRTPKVQVRMAYTNELSTITHYETGYVRWLFETPSQVTGPTPTPTPIPTPTPTPTPTPPPSAAPQFSLQQPVNHRQFPSGSPVTISAFWTDDAGLSRFDFETNTSGSLANITVIVSGLSNFSNYTFPSLAEGAYIWRVYATDTDTNMNVTPQFDFSIAPAAPTPSPTPVPPVCPNAVCETGEDCDNCYVDCVGIMCPLLP